MSASIGNRMKQTEVPTTWQPPPCQEDWEAELENLEDAPPFILNIKPNNPLLPCHSWMCLGAGGPPPPPAPPPRRELRRSSEEASDLGRAVSCVLRTVPTTASQHFAGSFFLGGGWIQPVMKHPVCPPHLPSRNPGAPAPDAPPPARAGVTGATWSREYRLSPSHTSSPPKFPSFLTSCDSTSSIALLLGGGGGGGVGETQKKNPKKQHLLSNCVRKRQEKEEGRNRRASGHRGQMAAPRPRLAGDFEVTVAGGGSLEKPRPLPAPQQHPSPGGVALVGIAPREVFLG
ncbi:gametocyte-specific factor 1 isoform X4 [Chroicocephalus ridibundus]